jgi:hypothetical protein
MGDSRRDEEDVARLERHRRLAFELILHLSFEHVDNLLAGVPMLRGGFPGVDVDARLNHLASGETEVVSLQIGAVSA